MVAQESEDFIHSDPGFTPYQARTLGKEMVKGYKGQGKCLIIHHPVSKTGMADINRMLEAFKDSMGQSVSEFILAPIKNVDMDAELIPEEAMMEMTAEDFNKVIKKHPDCDIIITSVPLPFNEDEIYAMDIFKMIEDPENSGIYITDPNQNYPRLGIYNGYVGNLEPLIEEGLIYAMSLWRPKPNEKTIEEYKKLSDEELFNDRYLLLKKSNIAKIKSEYPRLFPKLKRKND